jgi:thiaminase
MNEKRVLEIKRMIAQDLANSLEPDGRMYTTLTSTYGGDEEAEEAMNRLRHTLERLAAKQIRMTTKRMIEYSKKPNK